LVGEKSRKRKGGLAAASKGVRFSRYLGRRGGVGDASSRRRRGEDRFAEMEGQLKDDKSKCETYAFLTKNIRGGKLKEKGGFREEEEGRDELYYEGGKKEMRVVKFKWERF